MHQKRSKMPKTWPIPRKGSKYLAVASHAKTKGIPLLFVLRDILKIAKTRKEARYFVLRGDVKVNNKIRKDETFPIQVFDVVSLDKINKNYRLNIINKKFNLEEVSDKDAEKKIVKISGKKILGENRVQMNLNDGQNFLIKDKFNVNDSALINTKENKVEKILTLKKGAKIEIISGKHVGEKGKLKDIESLGKQRMYHIQLKDKDVKLPLKTILVIE